MQAKRLSENLLVSSQLLVTDVATAVALGIRSIINNRPDGEAPDQPSSAEIEAAAKAAGLGYRHIPVPPGLVLDEHIDAFSAAISELDSPILAFCRTGSRSVSLGRSSPQPTSRSLTSCQSRVMQAAILSD
jgi:sulfide:quinone oxidoreductase